MKPASIALILTTLLLSAGALADEIRVKKMTKDATLERSFILQTNLTEKVVIDCQSFIQGLRIGEGGNALVYLMDPEDCEELQGRMRTSLRKFRHHCMDVDTEIHSDWTCD